MSTLAAETTPYVLGSTSGEHDRLRRQSRLLDRITRHWLENIGVGAGMRILDVGSGVGDMAMLLASLGGPTAEIVGIDLDEFALAIARPRIAEAGLERVSFQVGNFLEYESDRPFDALVGRMILIHQPSPTSALRSLLTHLRPGGIVAFQEPWFSQIFCYPQIPLLQDLMRWITATFKAAGLDPDLGSRLHAIFQEAGLPAPELCFEHRLDCRADGEIIELGADTVRSLLPTMERLGIVTREVVQPDTLASRLHRQAVENGAIFGVMPMVGAWSRKH
jgi:SAM-dependent methyltransferase